MTIKLARIYLFIFVVFTLLWTQHANSIAQKIAIENSYQQKVSAAISSLLGDEKFLVIVSIEFSTIGGTLKKNATPQSGTSSQGTYIPGLPTVPSIQGNTPSSSSKKSSGGDLEIGRIDVIIGMHETTTNKGSIKQEIKSLVETIIPQIQGCEDCFKIQAMQFQTGQKNKRLAQLEEQILELEKAKRDADLKADQQKIEDLEKQLYEAEEARTNYAAIENIRKLEAYRQDSIRFQNFLKAERNRRVQDSIKFVNTEKRLERVMDSKIKSDSVIISETMGIVKQQVGLGKEDESLLGMQVGSGSSSIMSYVLIIFLIISLMVVTFLAANNKKPKTIYLKPKDSGKEKKDDKKTNNTKAEKSDSGHDESDEDVELSIEVPPLSPSKPDEDAMRSELKSLRQTAVSLTVGEKEGASALIKEWLEDNPNKEESTEETGEE